MKKINLKYFLLTFFSILPTLSMAQTNLANNFNDVPPGTVIKLNCDINSNNENPIYQCDNETIPTRVVNISEGRNLIYLPGPIGNCFFIFNASGINKIIKKGTELKVLSSAADKLLFESKDIPYLICNSLDESLAESRKTIQVVRTTQEEDLENISNETYFPHNRLKSARQYLSRANEEQKKFAVLPLLDLLRIYPKNSAYVVLQSLLSLNDPKSNQFLLEVLLDEPLAFGTKGKEIFIQFYGGTHSDFSSFLLQTIKSDTENESILALAISKIGSMKLVSTVLPLVDLMNATSNYYIQMVAAKAMSDIGSERALPCLRQPQFYLSSNEYVKTAVRAAVEKIETALNLKGLLTGQPSAITWAKDVIRFNDGLKHDLEMMILEKWFIGVMAKPLLKKDFKLFLKEEIDSQYHTADQVLVKKMEEIYKKL